MSSGSSQFLGADSSTSSLPCPARCPACGSRGNPNKTTRNLVVCIDGTANKFGRKNTNVVKLFEAVDCDIKDPWPEQYTYYSSGIGTRPRIIDVFQRVQRAISDRLDMAIAWNVEEIVKDAYAWLAGKYQEGDQIYLFGFSRGAYQVRILAGMIYEVGLIKNPTEKQIGTAYDHFESILSHKPNANDLAREFKMTFSWKDVRAHFIGVWDTVSSVGLGRGDVCLSASSAAAHACQIRHALALDERRVKFIPEYFLEMNSPDLHQSTKDTQPEYRGVEANNENGSGTTDRPEAMIDHSNSPTSDGSWNPPDDDTVLEDRAGFTAEKAQSTLDATKSRTQSSSNGEFTDRKIDNIKEVWFAGCHSDVGGTNRPGKKFHAGNVSLTWMRREASKCGLVLKPGDIFWTLWTDEDLDLGTTDSMTPFWKLFEFLPFQHEVSFSGFGENARRLHLFEPRRIIPGQKIHASVQFANTYIPKATFGNGFGNPLETAGPMPSEDDIWEKGAIDHTTYVALFNYLTGRQGAAPFYLHKLLFLLRFTEGRLPIKEVPDWQRALADLITKQSDLVRLVAMAAYFEAVDSSDLKRSLPDEVFIEARQSLTGFLKPDQPDWPRAVALLRPLAKHKDLRDLVLTTGVVDGFLELLDHIIVVQGEHFAHVMDALCSLVEFHPDGIVTELVEPFDGTRDRLSFMLDTNDPRHLTAVLRVVNILAEQEPLHCQKVESRLHELAKARKGPVSLLAVQALVEVLGTKFMQEPGLGLVVNQPPSMHRSPTLRSSMLLGTVHHLHAGTANHTPAGEWMRVGDSLLYKMFSARTLGNNRREFIQKLLTAASGRQTRARTAATFTLLNLCNIDSDLRMYVLKQGILDVLVKQLRFKDSALLAAYALTRCLSHETLLKPIKQNPVLAGYIVNMIRLDYFDEAIGVTEGFAIFEDLVRCDKLKRQIMEYDIAALLERKLGAGKPAEKRTSLIYLNIFRIYGEDSLTQNLVERGMSHLRTNQWRSQKAGVAILCSLAQTWFGVEALKRVIPEVVNMVIPTHDSNTQRAINMPYTIQSKPPSSLLGPAFVMRVLANNETLREVIRQTAEYKRLKHLFLFGDLLGAKDTPIWQVNSPTRNDVLDVINQMIKSVDSVEGSTKGFILPDIRHWDRIFRLFRDGVVWAIIIPAVVAGVATLMAVGAVAVAPVVLSRKILEWVGRPWHLRFQDDIIRSLKLPDTESPTNSLAISVPPDAGPSGNGV